MKERVETVSGRSPAGRTPPWRRGWLIGCFALAWCCWPEVQTMADDPSQAGGPEGKPLVAQRVPGEPDGPDAESVREILENRELLENLHVLEKIDLFEAPDIFYPEGF